MSVFLHFPYLHRVLLTMRGEKIVITSRKEMQKYISLNLPLLLFTSFIVTTVWTFTVDSIFPDNILFHHFCCHFLGIFCHEGKICTLAVFSIMSFVNTLNFVQRSFYEYSSIGMFIREFTWLTRCIQRFWLWLRGGWVDSGLSSEEGFIQKARQTVVVAFWGKMAAH